MELIKSPPGATEDDRPPPEHRKHSLRTVFGSRSKRKFSEENKKTSITTQRTSDGRKYAHILSRQIYDSSHNASTYQVNKSRRPLDPPASEGQRKHPTASSDLVGDVSSIVHPVDGTEEAIHERSVHSSPESGETKYRLSPYPTVGFSDPASGNFENGLFTDISGITAVGRNDPNRPKPVNEAAILQLSQRKSTTDDSLGLLRDLSQILSRGEMTPLTPGASQIPVREAGHQPRVRDFAANGSASFSRARAAVRRRSRSPVKKSTGKQTEAPVAPDRSLTPVTCQGTPATPQGWSPHGVLLPPMASKEPARPPLAPPLPTNQEQIPGTNTLPVINHHSKAPSVVSAESTAEDMQSDASSGVVSNAQSAVFVKVPPQPGPAPLTPLPSLPEGLDNFSPVTRRASQSSQSLANPGNSPPKVPPQRSPARPQYKLYPSADSSPSKRPGSPIRMNAATEPEQVMSQPPPPLRSKRRGISFPRPNDLPTSMSTSTLNDLDGWKKERTENTRQKKLRDLARIRSHEAAIDDVELVTRNTVNGGRYHQGVAELPSPRDSDNSALFTLKHNPQPSDVSNPSVTRTIQSRDSNTLSRKLSPIMVVAEQEPISLVQQAPSQESKVNKKGTDEHSRGCTTNGFYVPPHLASPTLQGPDFESKPRPVSSHSLPVPRPVASRVLTPHLSPLLRGLSHRSSHHSSTQELSGLEARLSAMERKNAMLERAFLAVLNTSASLGGSLGVSAMEGSNGDSSSGLSGRNSDHSSRTSGTESLYAGLENLLALHSGSAGARWSTSSGP